MNAKKIIAITAVSLVILAETGVLQVANHYWRYDIRRPCCSFGTAYQTSVCEC